MKTFADRFWEKVSKDGPVPDQSNPHYAGLGACWIWTAAKTPDGYGVMGIGRKVFYAHRLSFTLHGGVLEGSAQVAHKCDNPNCVNPEHLLLASNQENMRDAALKGRCGPQLHPERIPRGEEHANSKLTEAHVREIRRLDASGLDRALIAREFRITKENVGCVVRRVTWRHVA